MQQASLGPVFPQGLQTWPPCWKQENSQEPLHHLQSSSCNSSTVPMCLWLMQLLNTPSVLLEQAPTHQNVIWNMTHGQDASGPCPSS
jgi:hypothetical protein